MKFELLSGIHAHGHGETRRIYMPGAVIESDVDLAQRFNTPGSVRFRPVVEEPATASDPTPAATNSTTKAFESMTLAELREMAEAEELEISPKATKVELIAKLSAAMV